MSNFSNLPLIILASQSPRRKKILEQAGFSFKTVVPDTEEKTLATASETVSRNARIKANTVAKDYPDHLVIAADTVVSLDEKILEKPKDLNEAKQMLKQLSGRSHQVISAVSISLQSQNIDFSETSEVFFNDLTSKTIDTYFSKVDPLDKAGAYNIDEHKELIIDHFTGEYENIMGLPITILKENLKKI
ncbi:MAG: Maf family protein [Lentisphaeraceae bacterium]|nr:Maf family protein [Lentisphaeraceae bacterium]